MKKQIITILLLGIVCVFSCKKEEIDINLTTYIRISNISGINVDTLYLVDKGYNTNNMPLYPRILTTFSDIKHDTITDFQTQLGVPEIISFVVKAGGYKDTLDWTCPESFVAFYAPRMNLVMPEGKYTFTLSRLDTINNEVIIGLTEYEENE